ncbi:hypothetical protein TNCV_4180731 [Trichonephila clavipes]|nr:hypothetical protein TNCV_4180731 [Trichonephila clavipes]
MERGEGMYEEKKEEKDTRIKGKYAFKNTGSPGLQYPKVMAYYYGITHQSVKHSSFVDYKPIRDFWVLILLTARAHNIRQSQTINLLQ